VAAVTVTPASPSQARDKLDLLPGAAKPGAAVWRWEFGTWCHFCTGRNGEKMLFSEFFAPMQLN